jgi:hypothetical protein
MTDEQLIILLSKERFELKAEIEKFNRWWHEANKKLDEANIKIKELTDKLNAQ